MTLAYLVKSGMFNERLPRIQPCLSKPEKEIEELNLSEIYPAVKVWSQTICSRDCPEQRSNAARGRKIALKTNNFFMLSIRDKRYTYGSQERSK
jgi:hypothetical protein